MLAEKTNFTITRMVRLLEVPRSRQYVWLDRKPSNRSIRREHIEHKVVWFRSDPDEVHGTPRILAELRAERESISRKTVAKTMKRLGPVDICPKNVEPPRSSTTPTPSTPALRDRRCHPRRLRTAMLVRKRGSSTRRLTRVHKPRARPVWEWWSGF